LCSNAANKILQRHVRFASLMAQRIDDASKSQYNLKYDYSETTRLANDISEASRSLSIYVTDMKDNLDKFVSVLEEVQVTVKKEPSLAERILGWLKYLFKAIARILATVCPPISALLLSFR
jgi:primosomal protein N''